MLIRRAYGFLQATSFARKDLLAEQKNRQGKATLAKDTYMFADRAQSGVDSVWQTVRTEQQLQKRQRSEQDICE
jgi:hypothetical protein